MVKLSKPDLGKALRVHSSATVRRNSANETSQSINNPLHLFQGYQPNVVHINGMRYEAINMSKRNTDLEACKILNTRYDNCHNNSCLGNPLESMLINQNPSEKEDSVAPNNALCQII